MNTELMGRIARAIEKEPDRYDQRRFGTKSSDCGTCFCIAGWAVQLEEPHFIEWDRRGELHDVGKVEHRAMLLLDMNDEDAETLFGTGWPDWFFVDKPTAHPVDGCVPDANEAVALLDWMVRNERFPEPEDFE